MIEIRITGTEKEIDEVVDQLIDKTDFKIYILSRAFENEDDKYRRYLRVDTIDKIDELVHDEDDDVRAAVAKKGRDCDLDILVHDEKNFVRIKVAEQGRDCDLDILVNDEDWQVRKAVAKQGRKKDLDILYEDDNKEVKAAVIDAKSKQLNKQLNRVLFR